MAQKKKVTETPPKQRKAVHLAQFCLKQVEDVLATYKGVQRVEIAEHLLQTFTNIAEFYMTSNENVYNTFIQREEALLKRYGKAFKPLVSKNFYKLFDFQLVLTETEYYTSEEFNALEDQVNQLIPQDIQDWTNSIKFYLRRELQAMYLDQEPEFEISTDEELSGATKFADKEMTEARRVLAVYFLLKAGFNVEYRSTNSAHSSVAITRLIHLLHGKPFTTAQNSSLYAKYKKMPEYNSGTVLVKDLRYIRQYFEALDMKNILELIDEQIKYASMK